MNDLQKARNFVEFTHGSTRYRCAPETAMQLRKTLEKMPKHKPEALSTKNLTRQYPAFLAGHTTTAEYIERFQSQFDGRQHPVTHDCANYHKQAPMLDPTQPEVLEELDPDYTPPFLATPKAKKQTVASLKLSIGEALALLAKGDIDTAQCVLNEALGGVN
jgi:hypothetical protein